MNCDDVPGLKHNEKTRFDPFGAIRIVVQYPKILAVLHRPLNADPHSFYFLRRDAVVIDERNSENELYNLVRLKGCSALGRRNLESLWTLTMSLLAVIQGPAIVE